MNAPTLFEVAPLTCAFGSPWIGVNMCGPCSKCLAYADQLARGEIETPTKVTRAEAIKRGVIQR